MSDLQIENIIKGIASGQYVQKVGSQFGSIWGFDGLLAVEATPAQYAAFGAARDIKLCEGQDINWLGRRWSIILAYCGQNLSQVSAYTACDEQLAVTAVTWLTLVLGNPTESPPEITWVGRDGLVVLTKTPEFLHVDARRFKLLERLVGKLKSLF